MSTETQITTCTENYKMWKEKAFGSSEIGSVKKATERAFFWLELRSALMFLNTIEKTRNDNETKRKLIEAKTNLSKKLSQRLRVLLDELRAWS